MTPEHINDALPRVPAGISALAGDLTDTEERAAAVEWLWNLYRDALRGPESDEQGSGGISRPTDNNRGLERKEDCTVQVSENEQTWDEFIKTLLKRTTIKNTIPMTKAEFARVTAGGVHSPGLKLVIGRKIEIMGRKIEITDET